MQIITKFGDSDPGKTRVEGFGQNDASEVHSAKTISCKHYCTLDRVQHLELQPFWQCVPHTLGLSLNTASYAARVFVIPGQRLQRVLLLLHSGDQRKRVWTMKIFAG